MKISKKEGLQVLQFLRLPSIQQIDVNGLDENSSILHEGLSVRTSPKKDVKSTVYLPSIHHCTDLSKMREFIYQNQNEYEMIVHKTVHPEFIGSASQYGNFLGTYFAIELFENFEKRKQEIIKNRVIIPVMGERKMISQLVMNKNIESDFQIFSKVITYLKDMPFNTYDIEFVVEEGQILFTDLTIQDTPEYNIVKSVITEKQKKQIEGKKIYNWR